MASEQVCSGVIVLSVWVDGSDSGDLRARFVASATQLGSERRERFAAVGIDGICLRLRVWLETLASTPAMPVIMSKESVDP
jgi:hypothetical protein